MMKLLFCSTHEFERKYINDLISKSTYDAYLSCDTISKELLEGFQRIDAVFAWACDHFTDDILYSLSEKQCRVISLRSAGYSNVNLDLCKELGISVFNVPDYSPESIAEFTFALILSSYKKIHLTYNRTMSHNFLLEGLMGKRLEDKVIGIVGYGRIGQKVAKIANGFGMDVIVHDPYYAKDDRSDTEFVSFDELLKKSDILSLNCPLTKKNKHMINKKNISLLKKGALVVNTGRGALIDTEALIDALDKEFLFGACLDVYEYESEVFNKNFRNNKISDQNILKLLAHPNSLVTSHQAFFTEHAIQNIVNCSFENMHNFFEGKNSESNRLC